MKPPETFESSRLLVHLPESAINRAVRTLLDLRETWESTTKEEHKDLVHVMLQDVGVDVVAKRILWMKARPDYEPLFSIQDRLRPGAESRYWIECLEAYVDNCDFEVDSGQTSTGVEISPRCPIPDKCRGVRTIRICILKARSPSAN
jgi:hypothetical protein